MFGLGLGELIIIFLVALIFVGPKRLPEVGKKVGELYRQLRDMTETMRSTISHEIDGEPSPPKSDPSHISETPPAPPDSSDHDDE